MMKDQFQFSEKPELPPRKDPRHHRSHSPIYAYRIGERVHPADHDHAGFALEGFVLDAAKIGTLLGSFLSACPGIAVLLKSCPKETEPAAAK